MLTGKPKNFIKFMAIPWEKLFNLPLINFIYSIGGMIMSYIYKITNLITGKLYIGYTSRSIQRRFYEHKWSCFNLSYEDDKSALYNSMRKYGTNNFIVDQIIEFNEEEYDWKELEKFYIKEFNTLVPNGYNILTGGEKPPTHYGNENKKTKIKDEDLPKLFKMLKDTNYSYKDISKYFNISVSQLYRINKGEFRHQKNITYPIRIFSQQEEYALQVIKILSEDVTLSNTKIAELIPNYFRANEIASINNGKKYAYLWNGDFPIRKVTVPNNYDEKQQIALNILKYLKNKEYKTTQIQTQRDTGYSRMIVEKTLKGIYPYNISNIEYPIKLNN